MPLMINSKSGQQRIVPARSRSIYEQRGWKVAPAPVVQTIEDIADIDRPALNDPKSDWVAYAAKSGVDTDGLTKAEVVDAVAV